MSEFYFPAYFDNAFAAGATPAEQNAFQNNLSKPMQPDPWTRLSVNHDTIRIYADRIVPESILTFNFRFGNKGTLPTDSVTITCFPPNMSLPIGASPLTQWVGEDSKGPIDITGPIISNDFVQDPSLVTKIEWQVVSILPASDTEIDTNRIQFKLRLVIPRIQDKTGASLDLQCWMGLFFNSNLNEPIAFDVVTIRVEFMPIFEVEKQISPTTILPGKLTNIVIRTRNNGRREAENAVVKDLFYSSSGTVIQCIEVVSIDTPATDNTLPDIEWQN